jgi:hypothetical protein
VEGKTSATDLISEYNLKTMVAIPEKHERDRNQKHWRNVLNAALLASIVSTAYVGISPTRTSELINTVRHRFGISLPQEPKTDEDGIIHQDYPDKRYS